MIKPTLCMAALLAILSPALRAEKFDVVVYGGTAGGVIAAVSAARQGLTVALLEPSRHLGGMVSGGLSWTDYGRKEVIGGYALEFYWRVGRHYEMFRYGQDIAWVHEPQVAEEIFRQMLRDAHVAVLLEHRLREKDGVKKNGLAITEITMDNGASFTASIFIDSSYEGDLMAPINTANPWRAFAARRRCTSSPSMCARAVRMASCSRRSMTSPLGSPGRPTRRCRHTTSACASQTTRRTRFAFPNPKATTRSATNCSPACSRREARRKARLPNSPRC